MKTGRKNERGMEQGPRSWSSFGFALSVGIPWVFVKFRICITDGGRCSPGAVYAPHACPNSHIYYRLELLQVGPSNLGERDYEERTERLD